MSQEAKGRIMGAEAKQGGGNVQAGGFAARAQVTLNTFHAKSVSFHEI